MSRLPQPCESSDGRPSGGAHFSAAATVRVDTGLIAGTAAGDAEHPLRLYLGIPYARPPVGGLRWRPPQPAPPWTGVLDCTSFRDRAAQCTFAGPPLSGSEDCLYLSVVTPARSAGERLPVMVWLHGGGYTFGSGNSPRGHAPRLPGHGIVRVNVNMRLGVLGLLAHPRLSAESPRGSSGNYMFLDVIEALRWVRRNIAAFGGDPDNVTVFGQSGGAAKVANLLCSPLAEGLFHRAICQSGTSCTGFFPGTALAEAEEIGEEVLAEAGAAGPEQARALPWERVVRAALRVGAVERMDAAVDGRFLDDLPGNVFAAGRQHRAPLLVCANLGEVTAGAATWVFPTLIPGYLNMLQGAARAGTGGWACLFDQVPAGWRGRGITAIHGMELAYVDGDWDDSTGEWGNTHQLAVAAFGNERLSRDPGLTEADRRVSEAVMRRWSTFARTGSPDWPAWRPDEDRYLHIADPPAVRQGFSRIGLQ